MCWPPPNQRKYCPTGFHATRVSSLRALRCQQPPRRSCSISPHQPLQRSCSISPHQPLLRSCSISPHQPLQRSCSISPHQPLQRSCSISPHQPPQRSCSISPHQPLQRSCSISPHQPPRRSCPRLSHLGLRQRRVGVDEPKRRSRRGIRLHAPPPPHPPPPPAYSVHALGTRHRLAVRWHTLHITTVAGPSLISALAPPTLVQTRSLPYGRYPTVRH
jgi:hypothetical protein